MDYQGRCIAEIGTNGTGKTHTAIEILKRGNVEVQKHFDVVLILVSDDSETILKPYKEIKLTEVGKLSKGWVKLNVDDVDEVFKVLFDVWENNQKINKNVALLVDDAMAILDTRNKWVMKFFKKRRQRNCDIIMNCHGASEYPRSLFKNTTDFLIFQTTDSLQEIEARMSRDLTNRLRLAVEYVNMVAANFQNTNNSLKYFRFLFSQKSPPEIEIIRKLIASKWWHDEQKQKIIINQLNKFQI